jgi:flagellar hook-associated protein 3 FlgL
MTISNNVSLLAQSTSQSNRLSDLRATFDDLERQVTTQKKYANYSGFGTDSVNLQRLHNSQTMTNGYLDNINTVLPRINMMSQNMTQIAQLGTQLLSTINLAGGANIDTINQVAQQNLGFTKDLTNQQLDGRYLFAGSDAENQPFTDSNTLNSNFSDQINSWLANGGSAPLISATDAFSTTNLGLSAGLANSGAVTARIGQSTDIDYTVKADQPGFKDIISAFALLSNLKQPGPGDTATSAEFNSILSHATDVLTRGVQEMNDANQQLAGKTGLIKSIQDNHTSDTNLLQTQIDSLENADPQTAIINMQSLQNQLTASYQVTKIVSQLSLVNFM